MFVWICVENKYERYTTRTGMEEKPQSTDFNPLSGMLHSYSKNLSSVIEYEYVFL